MRIIGFFPAASQVFFLFNSDQVFTLDCLHLCKQSQQWVDLSRRSHDSQRIQKLEPTKLYVTYRVRRKPKISSFIVRRGKTCLTQFRDNWQKLKEKKRNSRRRPLSLLRSSRRSCECDLSRGDSGSSVVSLLVGGCELVYQLISLKRLLARLAICTAATLGIFKQMVRGLHRKMSGRIAILG